MEDNKDNMKLNDALLRQAVGGAAEGEASLENYYTCRTCTYSFYYETKPCRCPWCGSDDIVPMY